MSPFLIPLLAFSLLAYALLGGVFLAFSDFLMRSLARTPAPGGVQAMQVINREVFRWIFIPLFLAMAPVSVLLAIVAGLNLSGAALWIVLLAAPTYLIGCFGVTMVCNVPMNQTLDSLDSDAPRAEDYWRQTYLPRWTFWNTVRCLACVLSALLVLIGLLWHMQAPVI